MPRHTSRAGFSLIEMTVGTAAFMILIGGMAGMMQNSRSLFSTSIRASQARQGGDVALSAVRSELQQTTPDRLEIDHRSESHDSLSFQVPLSVGPDGNLVWGAKRRVTTKSKRDDSEIWEIYPDHRWEYFLAPSGDGLYDLKRRLIAPGDIRTEIDETLARHCDAPASGGKAFQVEELSDGGRVLRLTLRLRRRSNDRDASESDSVVRTRQVTVRLRGS